ncbi:MAG: hypothetical protein AAFR05_05895, partial [Bacteroidota bacterium]
MLIRLWHRIRQSTFFVKWTQWEYYPVYIANIPTVLFWLYFALRARALFYFSTVNPVIETGGVMGESKINILRRLPARAIPRTVLVGPADRAWSRLRARLAAAGIDYPLVAKPDVGERGFLVEKIDDPVALQQYLARVSVDFIVQDFVDYPLEISVLYYRMPGAENGKITSVCIKKTLRVRGDGRSTIEDLMRAYPRARFQLARFRQQRADLLRRVPAAGEEVELEPIGNHSRGTTFLNGNAHIDAALHRVFDDLSREMAGIHYGRFDLKCASIEALREGRDFRVLEFN